MKSILAAALAILVGALCVPAQHQGDHHTESAKISGTWQLTMDSPHGPLRGPFKVEQDGAKLTATYEAEGMGTIQFNGTLQGTRVSFEVPGSDMAFKMSGTVDGDKMSGTTSLNAGAWKATRQ